MRIILQHFFNEIFIKNFRPFAMRAKKGEKPKDKDPDAMSAFFSPYAGAPGGKNIAYYQQAYDLHYLSSYSRITKLARQGLLYELFFFSKKALKTLEFFEGERHVLKIASDLRVSPGCNIIPWTKLILPGKGSSLPAGQLYILNNGE